MKNLKVNGGVYLTAASLVYMASGYLLSIWLARYLGPSEYGLYGVVISIMTLVNLIQTAGIPQALSKFISSEENNLNALLKKSLKIQIILSFFLSILLILMTPIISAFYQDSQIAYYVLLTALILPFYGIYSILIGYYNGLHDFYHQASLNINYSLAKIFLVILLTYYYGLEGTIIGFVLAPLLSLLSQIKPIKSAARSRVKVKAGALINFSVPLVIFTFLSTLILSLDLLLIKKLMNDDASAGFYLAAQNISLIPYLGLSAFSQMALPTITKLLRSTSEVVAAEKFDHTLRTMLILLIPIVTVIGASSDALVTLLYSVEYLPAARPLSLLVIAYGILALCILYANSINGTGRVRWPILTATIGVIISGILSVIFIPIYGLIGAAFAVLTGGAVMLVLLHILLSRFLPIKVPFKVLSILLLVSIPTYILISLLSNLGILYTILSYCMALAIYSLALKLGGLLPYIKEFISPRLGM